MAVLVGANGSALTRVPFCVASSTTFLVTDPNSLSFLRGVTVRALGGVDEHHIAHIAHHLSPFLKSLHESVRRDIGVRLNLESLFGVTFGVRGCGENPLIAIHDLV